MSSYAIAHESSAEKIKSDGWIATPSTWQMSRVEQDGTIKNYCGVEFELLDKLSETQKQELEDGEFVIFENANDVREFLQEFGTINFNGQVTMKGNN